MTITGGPEKLNGDYVALKEDGAHWNVATGTTFSKPQAAIVSYARAPRWTSGSIHNYNDTGLLTTGTDWKTGVTTLSSEKCGTWNYELHRYETTKKKITINVKMVSSSILSNYIINPYQGNALENESWTASEENTSELVNNLFLAILFLLLRNFSKCTIKSTYLNHPIQRTFVELPKSSHSTYVRRIAPPKVRRSKNLIKELLLVKYVEIHKI